MELTRRHALAGAAGIAAAPLLPEVSAIAAAPIADRQAPSFYRYKVGDILVTVVSDGKNVFKLEDSFIPNAKRDDVNAALERAYMPSDMMTIYFAPLVINTGGKLVVIDTGNGALAKAGSKGTNGLFADNFVAAVVAVEVRDHDHVDILGVEARPGREDPAPHLRHGRGGAAPGAGLSLSVPGPRPCREGRQQLPGDPGAVESRDLTGFP
ncbi:hypothetical protein [Bradyrhizobium sp. ISRA443]